MEEKVNDERQPFFKSELQKYKRRWLILFLYSCISISNALCWITFSPISDKVEAYFNTSTFWVNNLSLIYLVVSIPLAFAGSFGLDKWGLRAGVMIGLILTFSGGWLRVVAKWSYWGAMSGQLLCATAQPFILSAPTMLAANWFPNDQRTIATTIGTVSNPIGVAVGVVISPLLVSSPDNIPFMLFIEAIIISVLLLPSVFFLRDKPPIAPSYSAQVKKEESLLIVLPLLAKNPNFWILFVEFTFALGVFNMLGMVTNEILLPYGYSNTESGILGALSILFGLIGSFITGSIVDRTKKYKLCLLVCLCGAAGATGSLTLSLNSGKFLSLAVSVSLLGLFVMPVLPVSLELNNEITFPLSEATPTACLITGGQISGITMVFLADHFISSGQIPVIGWFSVGSFIVSVIVVIFFHGTLQRKTQETRRPSINNENNSNIVSD